MSVSIAFAFLLITATNLVYAQPDQIHSYITNSVNIQNMQVKKSTQEILILHTSMIPLLKSHGNYVRLSQSQTTTGTKPFSIQPFANDTAGLLDALRFLDIIWVQL